MRFALLVLGYREPEVLRATVPLLRQAGFDIFVHLDAKADQDRYITQMGPTAEQCRFIDRRCRIFWGGFSMVEAELGLIAAAMETDRYERFALISDDTVPLLPAIQLRAYMAADHDRVMLRRLGTDDPFMARYTSYFHLDHPVSSLTGRPIESAAIDDDFLRRVEAIQALRQRGKAAIDVYYGSQWWSITGQTMDTILARLDGDRHLLESFRHSAVPDELMFQSMVGNFVPISRVRNGPVYVEWEREPKPYIFTETRELAGIGSEYAFARKFSSRHAGAYQHLLGP